MPDRPRASAAMWAGSLEVLPILLGVVPFGVIAGIVAVEAGLSTAQAIAASPVIFAGAAQLATMGLLAQDAAAVVIVLTALVINSRMAMYSAALTPWFKGLGPVRTALGAYLLTDQAFAVSTVRYEKESWDLSTRFAYYFGAGISLWLVWQVSTITGVLLGTEVPPSWSLDFAIPLVFLALVFPVIKDRGTRVAALVAALAAAATVEVPLHLGLLVSAFLGITAGLIAERPR